MGCCAVGPHSVGHDRNQWFEMLENPRKPVAQWYMLQENTPGGHTDHTPSDSRSGCLITGKSHSDG